MNGLKEPRKIELVFVPKHSGDLLHAQAGSVQQFAGAPHAESDKKINGCISSVLFEQHIKVRMGYIRHGRQAIDPSGLAKMRGHVSDDLLNFPVRIGEPSPTGVKFCGVPQLTRSHWL